MNVALEALLQVREGKDFPALRQILNRIKPEAACRRLPEFGYSLADYVWHADFWQRIWLARIVDEPAPSITEDWHRVEPHEWEATRSSLLSNLDRAVALAETTSDPQHLTKLLQIAVHDAYHFGQLVLLKRALKRVPLDDKAS